MRSKFYRIIAVAALLVLAGCAGKSTNTVADTYEATVGGFAFNSDSIPRSADVKAIAASIKELGEYSNVYVIGHSDNVGSNQENMKLSLRRAKRVADALGKEGIAAEKIQVEGRGYHEPVISNDTPGDRSKNRRVEIVVKK